MKIGKLKRRDYRKAAHYGVIGMNFGWFIKSKIILSLYGRYFLYKELKGATEILAAYNRGRLQGVLVARIDGEEEIPLPSMKKYYVKFFDLIQHIVEKGETDVYGNANKEMLKRYKERVIPDGEITYLAVNPKRTGKGTGTALLEELERREKGKTLYLYTDTSCDFQFYDYKGFQREEEKDIDLNLRSSKTHVKCFIYSKTM